MVGKAGVAGQSFHRGNGISDLKALVQTLASEIGDVDVFQQRLDMLEGAENRALEAKRNAKKAVKAAEKEAETKAADIIQAAEEQAQDRLGAIQDLEKRLTDDKRTWELEKSEEQSKLRSDRSKLGNATKAANEAKEKADKARADYEAAGLVVEEIRADLNRKYLAMQEIWYG